MKPCTVALFWLALIGCPQAGEAPPPAIENGAPGGWVRDEQGVWHHRTEDAYHTAYERRGCRIEENWDGLNYTAEVKCKPGVKPD